MSKVKKTKLRRPWWSYPLWGLGVLAVLAAMVLLGARLYFRIPVGDYYKASERGFLIPDCGRGFVAQGIAYDGQSGRFLVNGYQKDNIASPIYIIAPEARKPDKTIRMALPDGSDYTGHAGASPYTATISMWRTAGNTGCLFFPAGESMRRRTETVWRLWEPLIQRRRIRTI